MKKSKVLTSIILVMILVLSFIPTAQAASDKPLTSAITYQSVLDKLNAEYGTNVHFASPKELQKFNITKSDINLSIAEFEAYMRSVILANKEANADAVKQSSKLASMKVLESGSGICAKPSGVAILEVTVTREKVVPGATVHLQANVDNPLGYWMYRSIGSVWTTYMSGVNSLPGFFSETYNYSLIDARRTCAMNLYGVAFDQFGVIIDYNASRYVEFWAGSGM